MNKRNQIITISLSLGTALLYALVLVLWHIIDFSPPLKEQLPGADNRPSGLTRSADEVRIGEHFMRMADHTSSLRGQWSNFRGERFDNIVPLSKVVPWDEGDSPILWRHSMGEGHAAAAIYEGEVYVLDYDESTSSDMLRCFSLESGTELWRRWYRVKMKRNHGFSRTVPAVTARHVVTIGPQGHVMCCDRQSGDLLWGIDMPQRYRSEVPFWYTGQCPLIDGNEVVLAPCGTDTLLVGIDISNGKELWATRNVGAMKMSHSSVMPFTLGGKRTYVYMAVGGVVGVDAGSTHRGQLLWSTTRWQPSVVAPSALQLTSGSLLVVAGYGAGGARISVGEGGAKVDMMYKSSEGLACEQQTPILHNGRLYTVLPKDGGEHRGRLLVYSPSDLRSPTWVSGKEETFGLGPFLVVGNRLLVLKDSGELFTYSLESKTPQLIHRQVLKEGVDAWGPLAYADGYLVLRDAEEMICLKVGTIR